MEVTILNFVYLTRRGGTQIGNVGARSSVPVADGLFSVKLDFTNLFSPQFPGADRYL